MNAKSFFVANFIAIASQAIMYFILSFALTKMLSKDDYGAFVFVYVVYTFLNTLILLGSTNIISLYYHKVSRMVFKSSLSYILIYIYPFVFSLVFFISLLFYFEYLAVVLLAGSMFIPQLIIAFFQTKRNIKYFLVSILFHQVGIFLMPIFSVFLFGFDYIFDISIVYYIVFSLVCLRYFIKNKMVGLRFKLRHKLLLLNLKYTLPLSGYSILNIMAFNLDKYIVKAFVGLEELALYGFIFTLCSSYNICINAFAQTWGIYLYRNIKSIINYRLIFAALLFVAIFVPFIFSWAFQYLYLIFDNGYEINEYVVFYITCGFSFILLKSFFNGFFQYYMRSNQIIMMPVMSIAFYGIIYFILNVMEVEINIVQCALMFMFSQIVSFVYSVISSYKTGVFRF